MAADHTAPLSTSGGLTLGPLEDSQRRDRIEALSRDIFTAKHFLTVCLVLRVHSGEVLDRDTVATLASVPSTAAHNELQRLVRMGAVQRLDGGRSVFYGLVGGAFWTWVEELLRTSYAPADVVGASAVRVATSPQRRPG